MILQAQDRTAPGYQKAWAQLCARYWEPAFAYLRSRWALSEDDARDVTQEFFLHLYETDAVTAYRRERGHFRTFLLGALKNFTIDRLRQEAARKRGGGTARFSLDAKERLEIPSSEPAPEVVFERQWAMALLNRALEKVRSELQEGGKQQRFDAYRLVVLEPPTDPAPTRAEVGRVLGLSEAQVANYLADVRALLRRKLLEEIGDYTRSAEEAVQELKELFGL